jgi:hypothetical protein
MTSSTADAARPVVALAQRLRAAGVAVSTSETLDAIAALTRVDVARRSQVRAALRTTLLKSAAHERTFDAAFDAVFPRLPRPDSEAQQGIDSPIGQDHGVDVGSALSRALANEDDEAVAAALERAVEEHAGSAERSPQHRQARVTRQLDLAAAYRQALGDREHDHEVLRAGARQEAADLIDSLRRRLDEMLAIEAGQRESRIGADDLRDIDVLSATPDQLAALRTAVRPLARLLAARLGRRRRGRGTLDMRATVRASMGTGGVPVTPRLRRRHRTRPELVVLCDVSGSVAEYVPFALTLLQAVHAEFAAVRSFAFVDGVVEVSGLMDVRRGVVDLRGLLDRRGLVAETGRSDYSLALQRFLAGWPDVLSPRATVVVIGDARSWDRPSAISTIREIRGRSRHLYWLDPEPRSTWDDADTRIQEYADACSAVYEVATLRQLADAVTRIA